MPQINENLIAQLVERGVIHDTFRRLPSAKKARVYRAAIRLFGEFGYDGLAVDQFCKEAGISKGSFFQYFPSKSHLLEFAVLMYDDVLERLSARIKAEESAALARKRLMYLYNALALRSHSFRTERRFYLFVTNALHHAGVAIEGIDLERHFRSYVTEIIHRGQQTGEIRSDYNADEIALMVTSTLAGRLEKAFLENEPIDRDEGERLLSFIIDGISA